MERYEEAIPLAKEGLQISPNDAWATAFLVAAFAQSGRIAEARAVLARFDPRQAGILRTGVGFGPKLSGMVDDALKLAGWTSPATAPETAAAPAAPLAVEPADAPHAHGMRPSK